MALIKFLYGTKEKLNAKDIENGAFYITTDEGKLYLDLEGERLPLTPIINVDEAALALSPRTVVAQKEIPTDENCLIWIKTSE